MFQNRSYRKLIDPYQLVSFSVRVSETDLWVHAGRHLEDQARESVLRHRGYIESYAARHPDFVRSLAPLRITGPAPVIVKEMAEAGRRAGVGPMAAVAGAVAEHVGRELLAHTDEVIVENGGDIFIKRNEPVTVAIFAGDSPLSLKIGLRVDGGSDSVSVCTSSGRIGHSLSLGRADAVCVVSPQCALADAAATAIGNRVTTRADIPDAIEYGNKINGVEGIVIVCGDRIGLWGTIEIVPLEIK